MNKISWVLIEMKEIRLVKLNAKRVRNNCSNNN